MYDSPVAAERPAGTVTFLATAVDGSIRSDETPAEAAARLELQDSIVRDVIGRSGGYLFARGDYRFIAAFATALDAAGTAVDLQRRLVREGDRLVFEVRVGLHTGEATAGEPEYVGPEVNRAVRLTSIAHGGQIVVSDTTELLLRSRMTLRSLGEHRLRDLDRRMTVYQIVADGLPSEFPALHSVTTRIGNLPEQLTSFVGRDGLLLEVADLVRSNQLVTLGGAGGVGKTRLALEVGAGLADEFPDGVWVVELASVGDVASVPAAIASTLGISPRAGTELVEAVAEALAGRRALVLMDNCEHVLPAASAAISVILGRSGVVRVLATSREYLWIAGETLVDVSPLALTGGVASDAVHLFVERARAVRPAFGVQDPQTAAAVTEICRVLDGLPLGIELAAARMAAMSAIEVRDRLGARFRLLRGPAARPERQQTLLRAVGWSYDLLDADEQRLMRHASVFSGGFDLPSISSVVGADDVDVLAQIDSLVRKSLVVADHGADHTRYRLYETIRQFSEDRLSETGGLARMRDRHAAHFAAQAAARWERWDGPGWRDAVDWVEAELGNLRTAFRWSTQRGRLEVATDIAAHAALMGFSVELFETVAWAEELLDSAAERAVARLPRLYTAAGYACFVGRAEAATVNAHRAVELESRPGFEPCEPGYATFVEALGQVYSGHLDRYVELTASVATQFGAARGYGLASYVDGLQACGRVAEALELVDPSIVAARDLGNPYWIAYALWIAGLAVAKADRKRALAIWDDAVDHVREHRVHFFDGFLARDAARLHTSDGEADRALVLFDTAIGASHQAGNVAQLIITLASVPALFERLHRAEAAMTLFAALSREPAAFHHVPELAELGERLSRRLGPERSAELRSAGMAHDLDDAAVWTRDELALALHDLLLQATAARPAGLSRREIDVLRLVAGGRTTSEIAAELFISAKTADHHIQHIYTKIGVSNRAAATRWAVRHEMVPNDTAR
jgi:predicted ATPase/class 3 adenylate cyclase/DNA-binding CsgD family transcriptional regulator